MPKTCPICIEISLKTISKSRPTVAVTFPGDIMKRSVLPYVLHEDNRNMEPNDARNREATSNISLVNKNASIPQVDHIYNKFTMMYIHGKNCMLGISNIVYNKMLSEINKSRGHLMKRKFTN